MGKKMQLEIWKSELGEAMLVGLDGYNASYDDDSYMELTRLIVGEEPKLAKWRLLVAFQDAAIALHSGNSTLIKYFKARVYNNLAWRKMAALEKVRAKALFASAFGVRF